MFRKRTAGEQIDPRLCVDGWSDCPVSSNPDKVGAAPMQWNQALSQQTRPLVYSVLLQAAADGASRRNPFIAWELLRSFSRKPADFGASGPVAAELEKNYVKDPVERAKWARAEREVSDAGGTLFLSDCLHRLTVCGDVLTTLRNRRDELNAQIAVLERRLGLAQPTDGAVAG
jgi:hypothetical protein